MYSSTIWSGLSLVVPSQGVALAYGLLSAGYSIGVFFSSLYFGRINIPRTVESYNQNLSSLLMMTIVLLGLSAAIWLLDLKRGGRLHFQENSEQVLKAKEKSNLKFREFVIASEK